MFRTIIAIAVVFASTISQAGMSDGLIQKLESWEEVQQMATEKNLPVVVFIDQTDCPYCEIVERDFINPVLISGVHERNAIFRKLVIDGGETITDERGERISAREFAIRYTEAFTPTILFLDGEGRELGESLVGLSTPDFYGYYLDRAIMGAYAQLN